MEVAHGGSVMGSHRLTGPRGQTYAPVAPCWLHGATGGNPKREIPAKHPLILFDPKHTCLSHQILGL